MKLMNSIRLADGKSDTVGFNRGRAARGQALAIDPIAASLKTDLPPPVPNGTIIAIIEPEAGFEKEQCRNQLTRDGKHKIKLRRHCRPCSGRG
jgi:hypothetical protein